MMFARAPIVLPATSCVMPAPAIATAKSLAPSEKQGPNVVRLAGIEREHFVNIRNYPSATECVAQRSLLGSSVVVGVGENILRKLNEREMSQADLARLAHVSPPYISKLMRTSKGLRRTNKSLAKIARVLACTVDELFDPTTTVASLAALQARVRRIEAADPFPNRADALRLLGPRIDPRAKEAILSRDDPADKDLSVDAWVEQTVALHGRVKRYDLLVDAIEKGEAPPEAKPKPVGTLEQVARDLTSSERSSKARR